LHARAVRVFLRARVLAGIEFKVDNKQRELEVTRERLSNKEVISIYGNIFSLNRLIGRPNKGHRL